ncbi:nuclear shuttle protein [Cajanus scarabaeoides yellow mosaic virus]|uniref:Nuclear shuttle protein n=1 Tax=Cajanus scarabaeoides yellow mosaic virus TaxID=3000307 RepID=A0A9E8MIB8_9GEMI|nr:nuclear shuttle protein [Cajanus scarabaeoides yellow mosaic virus]
MFKRNFRTPSKPRYFNSGKQFSQTPYKSRYRRNPTNVARKLSFDRVERPLRTNVLVERQHGSHMALLTNNDITSFVEFPARGVNGDGRSKEYVKLLHLNVSGVLNVILSGGDQPMTANDKLNGLFVLTLILDRKPFLPDGVNQLPTYAELFGPYSSAYVNLQLLDTHKERFKILGSCKRYVRSGGGASYAPLKLAIKLSNQRYPLWAAFKDFDQMTSGGNYKNIAKNAILVNYAFVAMDNFKVEPFVQFELKYLG